MIDEEDMPELQALMQNEDVPTEQICEWFGVSKATLYRYVGPDGERRRQQLIDSVPVDLEE